MGKPYIKEILKVASTYQWAKNLEIKELSSLISKISNIPLQIVASGGSLTVAYVAALLHEQYTGMFSKVLTPLELVTSQQPLANYGILFISAGGRNIDIIKSFEVAVEREPQKIIVICSNKNSPLAQLASKYNFVDLVYIELPTGKDGFLATNSMVCFMIVLCRAWLEHLNSINKLPNDLSEIYSFESGTELLEKVKNLSKNVWEKETISILYSLWTKPAAINFESNFTEAALGSVQIADYRNFAHGRHHWFAKKDQTSAIIAFITDDDRILAEKTLKLIPPNITVLPIDLGFAGETALIGAVINSLYLTAAAGEKLGIDPGKPGVPDFGRKIYHLNGYKFLQKSKRTFINYTIERKIKAGIHKLHSQNSLSNWQIALELFVKNITNTKFSGFVFDYDGTLCDQKDRFNGINDTVRDWLITYLEQGITIGIASGRGKSIKNDLIQKIPKSLWTNIVIGCYNGAEIGWLDQDGSVNDLQEHHPKIVILDQILGKAKISQFIEWETRNKQITLWAKKGFSSTEILKTIREIIEINDLQDMSILCSSHSIDILAPEVSKLHVVKELKRRINDANIVCMGDRGNFPGNDYLLLNEPFSLSVDEVSGNLETCWNLAPLGYRGVQATLHYFNCIDIIPNAYYFNLKKLRDS